MNLWSGFFIFAFSCFFVSCKGADSSPNRVAISGIEVTSVCNSEDVLVCSSVLPFALETFAGGALVLVASTNCESLEDESPAMAYGLSTYSCGENSCEATFDELQSSDVLFTPGTRCTVSVFQFNPDPEINDEDVLCVANVVYTMAPSHAIDLAVLGECVRYGDIPNQKKKDFFKNLSSY
jgi:hypothetical protein